MNVEELKKHFFDLVHPDLPNEWDVEESVESLVSMTQADLDAVFGQIAVIWPVSNSLCFSFLTQVGAALQCIGPDQLPDWVSETLDQYELSGLKAAQKFMHDVQGHFVCRLQGGSGLRFSEVEGRLLPYVRGLAKQNISLEQADKAGTDTATIFLPREMAIFSKEADNFLFYKLIASFQWGFMAQGSFLFSDDEKTVNPTVEGRLWLQEHFAKISVPQLLADIYHCLETLRVRGVLERELPGLMRDSRPLFKHFAGIVSGNDPGHNVFTSIHQLILGREIDEQDFFAAAALPLLRPGAGAQQSLSIAEELYAEVVSNGAGQHDDQPLPFQGKMQLERVAKACLKQREAKKHLFIESLATLLVSLPAADKDSTDSAEQKPEKILSSAPDTPEQAQTLIMQGTGKGEQEEPEEDDVVFVTINNEEIELGEELADLASEIRHDLGRIPEHYIASAAGRAGQGNAGLAQLVPQTGESLSAPVTYDEWDYRRAGFRRNWCIVTEKDIPVIRSTFIASTLDAYHGQIIKLRYQFEMLRSRERFVRRQRDGDDIDLDALVESLSDTVAGQPPSDRLFIRLQRDERDIAALFLVDMSNSTRGWVGKAIKESMVLICEAMESLGDRYAIYGFSGMRRLRCEIFPIKNFEQPYSDEVREKIGSISPREYTRMAPAIRHVSSILKGVDAKVRLLITLSDGKPEDYDDYKGEYAIEDTRHALIEAKMAGLHPFCITIDKHAHEYMAHMYGEVNYIFIDDVRKLPLRMPEIYRVLTS